MYSNARAGGYHYYMYVCLQVNKAIMIIILIPRLSLVITTMTHLVSYI